MSKATLEEEKVEAVLVDERAPGLAIRPAEELDVERDGNRARSTSHRAKLWSDREAE